MKRILILLFACVMTGSLCAVHIAAQEAAEETVEPSVTVNRAVFCTGVEEREPVGAAEEFPVDVGRIYCWTELMAAEPPSTVTHVWYHDDTKLYEVPLEVNYERTRTWSYKTILPDWTGEWRVEVVGADGVVIGRYTCTVGDE